MIKKSLLFLFLFEFAIFSIFSQEQKTEITIEDAIELVKANNPELKKQKLNLEDAKRTSENRWNKFLPNLSANASVSNGHDFAQSSNWNWKAGAGASLSFSFGLPATIQQAKLKQAKERISLRRIHSMVMLISLPVLPFFN